MNAKQAKTVDAVIKADLNAMMYDVAMFFTAQPRIAADGIEASDLAYRMGIDFVTVGQVALDWFIWWLNAGANGIVCSANGRIFPEE